MYGKLILCEYARATNNGSQFDALGAGVNNIIVPRFPAPIAFALLVETKYSVAETGRDYPFEIKIIDPDGKAAGPTLGGSIRVAQNHKGATYAAFNMQLIAKNHVVLTYSLLVNGEEKDSISLEIKQGNPITLVQQTPVEKQSE
jgi:hypothetical protein